MRYTPIEWVLLFECELVSNSFMIVHQSGEFEDLLMKHDIIPRVESSGSS